MPSVKPGAILRGLLFYAGFAAVLVVLSQLPRFEPVPRGAALLQVSIAHAGVRLAPCRRRTPEELAALAPNMRAPELCPRGRSAVRVTVELDGRMLVDETIVPSGLARDGSSTLYRRIPVAAGRHRLRVRVLDDLRAPARAVERRATVELAPGQVMSVDFKPARGGIVVS